MEEAKEPDLINYSTLSELFSRELSPGIRPVDKTAILVSFSLLQPFADSAVCSIWCFMTCYSCSSQFRKVSCSHRRSSYAKYGGLVIIFGVIEYLISY